MKSRQGCSQLEASSTGFHSRLHAEALGAARDQHLPAASASKGWEAPSYLASYLNQVRYYLHKAVKACPINVLRSCDLWSKDKRQKALENGRMDKWGPFQLCLISSSWFCPCKWPLWSSASALRKAVLTVQENMLVAPPRRHEGCIYWPSLEVPLETVFKIILDNFQRLSVLGM